MEICADPSKVSGNLIALACRSRAVLFFLRQKECLSCFFSTEPQYSVELQCWHLQSVGLGLQFLLFLEI